MQDARRMRVYSSEMEIATQIDDDSEFIRLVELTVNGVLHRNPPPSLAVIKIDNWFGSRWLGFCGKSLGLVGFTLKPDGRTPRKLRIPPFVPERVLSQRRFAAPDFREVAPGRPVHRQMPGSTALNRKAAIAEPETTLVWFSGNSKANGRGSLMVYAPAGNTYWCWFAELERGEPWRVTEAREIKPDDLTRLMEEGSASFASTLSR